MAINDCAGIGLAIDHAARKWRVDGPTAKAAPGVPASLACITSVNENGLHYDPGSERMWVSRPHVGHWQHPARSEIFRDVNSSADVTLANYITNIANPRKCSVMHVEFRVDEAYWRVIKGQSNRWHMQLNLGVETEGIVSIPEVIGTIEAGFAPQGISEAGGPLRGLSIPFFVYPDSNVKITMSYLFRVSSYSANVVNQFTFTPPRVYFTFDSSEIP